MTLWKKGKDNKQFLKRRFLLSRTDFTLRYFIKGDVSRVSYVSLLTLRFHVPILEPALPSNQVQGSQSCDLHEGPECSVPAWEDPPRSRPADLLPARRTDKESVCLSWGWIRESAGPLNFALLGVKCAAGPAASDICNVLNFCLSFSSSAKLCLRECNTKALICCLPGNCIPVQCHQGNTTGVPAEETSRSSRRWRETAYFFLAVMQQCCWCERVFPCSFNTRLSLQLLPLLTRQCLKEGYMEKTGPTVGQPCAQKMHSLMQRKLFTVVMSLCLCVFSNGSRSRRGGSRCAQSTESLYIIKLHW